MIELGHEVVCTDICIENTVDERQKDSLKLDGIQGQQKMSTMH